MSLTRIKSLISALIIIPSLLHGVVWSTVSPYIQSAAAQINAQVTEGMESATAKVNSINEKAKSGFKPQYKKKAKMLENIKKLQADSLLQLRGIQTETFAGSRLRAVEAKISGNSAQTDLIAAEKTSGIVAAELAH